jgi:hypothetical protein
MQAIFDFQLLRVIHDMKTILSLSFFALSLVMATATETNNPAPTTDRVGFPKDYAKSYEVLRTVTRDEGKKLVTVYGNRVAASVTNRTQLPYPNGSILVMETAGIAKDSTGQPVKDAAGNLVKEKVLGLHVMRREKDFGVAYAEKRSGEWEFVEYRADGSYITPPEKSATCAECHIKAGAEKDFVYNGRFGDLEKP